jgi:lipid II:glycine glycyltransferase (peptidoglycan interpeptide bridge formation enzyme)
MLRIVPMPGDAACTDLLDILAEEEFLPVDDVNHGATVLMDLRPDLEAIRNGMNPHWRRKLRQAERQPLDVVVGTSDELFGEFIGIYREMVARKKFAEGNDINEFRRMQSELPEPAKMRIALARSGDGTCAGAIYTTLGTTGLYLFAATSNVGLTSNASYTLQWQVIQDLKRSGCSTYDLNGINRVTNPGTFRFKWDMAGKHGKETVDGLCFDSSPDRHSYALVRRVDHVRRQIRQLVHR